MSLLTNRFKSHAARYQQLELQLEGARRDVRDAAERIANLNRMLAAAQERILGLTDQRHKQAEHIAQLELDLAQAKGRL